MGWLADEFWNMIRHFSVWFEAHIFKCTKFNLGVTWLILCVLMLYYFWELYRVFYPKQEWPLHYQTGAHPDHLPKYEDSRPLGQLEYIMMKLHEAESGILSVAIILSIDEPVTDKTLQQALFKVARMQPLLRMKIVKNRKTGIPYFEPIQDFRVDFTRSNISKWNDFLCTELERKFNTKTGPLWRVTFLPDAHFDGKESKLKTATSYPSECIMVFSFHRAIMEEFSIADICFQFIFHVNDLMNHSSEIRKIPQFPVLPSLDVNFTAQDINRNWYETMRNKSSSHIKVESLSDANGNKGVFLRQSSYEAEGRKPISQALVYHCLDKDMTNMFIDKCEQNRVATNAALEVATVLAYANSEAKKGEESLPLLIDQVVFLKDMLPAIPLDYIGNFSVENIIDTAIPTSADFIKYFWNLAASVTEVYTDTLQTANPVVRPDTAKTKLPQPESKLQRLRISSFGTLNLETYEEEGQCKVHPKGIYGHIGLKKDGALLGHCHTIIGDSLCWTLTYNKDVFSKKQANDLVKRIFYYIRSSLEYEPKTDAPDLEFTAIY